MNEKQLKAKITYYTARLNQTIRLAEMYMDRLDELKELEKPKYQTSISEELKNTIEKVNKTLDKQIHKMV